MPRNSRLRLERSAQPSAIGSGAGQGTARPAGFRPGRQRGEVRCFGAGLGLPGGPAAVSVGAAPHPGQPLLGDHLTRRAGMATAMYTLDAGSGLRRAAQRMTMVRVSSDILLISRGAQQVVAQLTAARANLG